MGYEEIRETVRERFGDQSGSEEAIAFMRGSGLRIIQCIKAVYELTGCSLGRAKLIVQMSATWADQRAGNERFQHEVCQALAHEPGVTVTEGVDFQGMEP